MDAVEGENIADDLVGIVDDILTARPFDIGMFGRAVPALDELQMPRHVGVGEAVDLGGLAQASARYLRR